MSMALSKLILISLTFFWLRNGFCAAAPTRYHNRRGIHFKLNEKLIFPNEVIDGSYLLRLRRKSPSSKSSHELRHTIKEILARCESSRLLHEYPYSLYGASLINVSATDLITILDDPAAVSAEKDGIILKFAVQDGLDDVLWGLDRIDQKQCVLCNNASDGLQSESSASSDPYWYGLPNQYRYDWTGQGVIAYVVDSGIKALHNEFTSTADDGTLTSRASCGKNFRLDKDETCENSWGHGTHVASIIGGKTYGVAKKVSLVSVKVLGNDGTSRFSDIIAGIEYVISQKALNPTQPMLINLSIGTSAVSPALNAAVDQAVAVGIPVVVAAGNGSVDACTFSPASSARSITVAASTPYDQHYNASNWGDCVDLYAPGVAIQAAWVGEKKISQAKVLSGTSMAAPFVSGVVALLLERDPLASPETILEHLVTDGLKDVITNTGSTPNILLNVRGLLVPNKPSWISSSPSPSPTILSMMPSSTPSVASLSMMPSSTPSVISSPPTIVSTTLLVAPSYVPDPILTSDPSFTPTALFTSDRQNSSNATESSEQMPTASPFDCLSVIGEVDPISTSAETTSDYSSSCRYCFNNICTMLILWLLAASCTCF